MNKKKIALGVFAIAITALLLFRVPQLWSMWNTGGGSDSVTATDGVEAVLGVTPVDLTEGGTKSASVIPIGGCVNIFDRNMRFLVEDCDGQFHDLRGLGATFYASSRSDQVKIRYTTW